MTAEKPIPRSGMIKTTWIAAQILWYAGWVAAAINVALILATATSSFEVKYVRLPIEVTFDQPLSTSYDHTTSETLPVVGYEGRVKVEAENMRWQTGWLFIPALLLAGYLFIAYLLRAFIRTVRDGSPFIRENPKRLRTIGYCIAAAGPVYGILNFLYARVHLYQIDIPDACLEVPIDIHPLAIFLGLVILIIAQVFDYGVRLQTDQDLTV
ncbi:MAG TPA: DUF2975 domain-containing protein [Acidobacteriota bacterium]|nr:DUF2975 domain-containing protein [Acidobacteriota bacterium]